MSSTHFSKVPHWLLAKVADGSLIPNALITYVAVAKYVNHRTGRGAWPANRTLRADTGFSERTVREHLAALEECGAVQRIARHSEHGRQTTNLVILIDDEPDTATRRAVAPPGEQSPPPAATRPPGEQSPSDQMPDLSQTGGHSPPPPGEQSPPYELEPVTNQRVPTFQSSTTPDEDGSQSLKVSVEEPSRVRDVAPLPIVYQRLLSDRHGVSTAEQREAWSSAWDRAEEIKGTVPFEPYDHLAKYLTGCTEGRYRATAQRWLGFFIEDRGVFISRAREDAERRVRSEETPQEREDRLNRPLPPADWGIPPAAAETGDEQ